MCNKSLSVAYSIISSIQLKKQCIHSFFFFLIIFYLLADWTNELLHLVVHLGILLVQGNAEILIVESWDTIALLRCVHAYIAKSCPLPPKYKWLCFSSAGQTIIDRKLILVIKKKCHLLVWVFLNMRIAALFLFWFELWLLVII